MTVAVQSARHLLYECKPAVQKLRGQTFLHKTMPPCVDNQILPDNTALCEQNLPADGVLCEKEFSSQHAFSQDSPVLCKYMRVRDTMRRPCQFAFTQPSYPSHPHATTQHSHTHSHQTHHTPHQYTHSLTASHITIHQHISHHINTHTHSRQHTTHHIKTHTRSLHHTSQYIKHITSRPYTFKTIKHMRMKKKTD